GVAQGIEDGAIVGRNALRQRHNVGCRNLYELGEAPGSVHAEDAHRLADVRLAAAALEAMAAVHVHVGGDILTGLEALDLAAHAFDVSAELMAERQRRVDAPLSPAVPFIDVEV